MDELDSIFNLGVNLLLQGNQQLNESQTNAANIRLQGTQNRLQDQRNQEAVQREISRDALGRSRQLEDQAFTILSDRISTLQRGLAFIDANDTQTRAEVNAAIDDLFSKNSLRGENALSAAMSGTYTKPDGTEGNAIELIGMLGQKEIQFNQGVSDREAARQAANKTLEGIMTNAVNYSDDTSTRTQLQNLRDASTTPVELKDQINVILSAPNIVGDYASRYMSANVSTAEAGATIEANNAVIAGVNAGVSVSTAQYAIEKEKLSVEQQQEEINRLRSEIGLTDANKDYTYEELRFLQDTHTSRVDLAKGEVITQRLNQAGIAYDNRNKQLMNKYQGMVNDEMFKTFDKRVEYLNKTYENGVLLSDQEVALGGWNVKIGEQDYYIKMENLNTEQLINARTQMENTVYGYDMEQKFITDIITTGNTNMINKIRIEQANPGTYPNLSEVAQLFDEGDLVNLEQKATANNILYQQNQQLALAQVYKAGQDLQWASISDKTRVMQELSSAYSPEELDVLAQQDPVIKGMMLNGTITQTDINAAKTLSGIQVELRNQGVNAQRVEALQTTILENYRNPPVAGQEQAYANGLMSAIEEYGTLLGLPSEMVQEMKYSITSGYEEAWKRSGDAWALEKALTNAEITLRGAQARLANANSVAAMRSGSGGSGSGLTANQLWETGIDRYNIGAKILDDMAAPVQQDMDTFCALNEQGNMVDAGRCGRAREQWNNINQQRVDLSWDSGIPTILPSSGQLKDQAVVDFGNKRYNSLYDSAIAQGMSPEQADAWAQKQAISEASQVLTWDTEDIRNQTDWNQPFVPPVTAPTPGGGQSASNSQWGLHNAGANIGQAGDWLGGLFQFGSGVPETTYNPNQPPVTDTSKIGRGN